MFGLADHVRLASSSLLRFSARQQRPNVNFRLLFWFHLAHDFIQSATADTLRIKIFSVNFLIVIKTALLDDFVVAYLDIGPGSSFLMQHSAASLGAHVLSELATSLNKLAPVGLIIFNPKERIVANFDLLESHCLPHALHIGTVASLNNFKYKL